MQLSMVNLSYQRPEISSAFFANFRTNLISFLVLILSGICGATEARHEGPRGEIRIVESWRPDLTVVYHNVFRYLFEYALDSNELLPFLAASGDWIDDTTLELTLREVARFNNGEPFDAYAVKFNLDYQRQHNPHRYIQVFLKNIKEIRVIDSHTIRIILNQPDALLLQTLSYWRIGAPRYMERVGWERFERRPIGTGPYVVEGELKDYRKASEGEIYATLTANPDYWERPAPKIKHVKFVQHSPKEALRALIEGRVDLVTSLIPKDTLKVEESPHSKVAKNRQDVRSTKGYLNLKSPRTRPLRNLLVRKALNYAIDREELMRYAFKGNADKMRGILTEKSGVDLSGTKQYERNIPKARMLLKEAGYGQGFKIKLYYHEKDYLIAHLLKRFYSLLKITVEITPVQWEWFVRHIVYPNTREGYSWDDEDWWIAIYSDPGLVPEVMAGLLEWNFHSGAAWQTFPNWLGEPLDMMYRDLLKTRDSDQRFQIYKKANEYIADQALNVFTVAPLALYGVSEQMEFVPQVSQWLYLEYSFVKDGHRSVQTQRKEVD